MSFSEKKIPAPPPFLQNKFSQLILNTRIEPNDSLHWIYRN
jgi:hypothetical protein